MLRHIIQREIGYHSPNVLREKEITRRTFSLEISENKTIQASRPSGAILCLDVDNTENRYLISGNALSNIDIFDIGATISPGKMQFKPIVTLNRQKKSAISAVQWYPNDTGIFLSGSFDSTVAVWDTNSEEVVRVFPILNKVYAMEMSRCSLQHTLVAVGSEDPKIFLCDLKTGLSVWQLNGHKDTVLSLAWSPNDEYTLVSGSVDGTVRLWDVRRPGPCVMMFNQHMHTQTNTKSKNSKRYNYFENANILQKAHDGRVTSVIFTTNGHQILSTGTDNRMRLWDIHKGTNELVNYAGTVNRSKIGNHMAVSTNGQLVYHPNGKDIIVYEISTGAQIHTLKNHFGQVNYCCFHPSLQELYSASHDGEINIWCPLSENPQDDIQQNNENLEDWDSSGEDR